MKTELAALESCIVPALSGGKAEETLVGLCRCGLALSGRCFPLVKDHLTDDLQDRKAGGTEELGPPSQLANKWFVSQEDALRLSEDLSA